MGLLRKTELPGRRAVQCRRVLVLTAVAWWGMAGCEPIGRADADRLPPVLLAVTASADMVVAVRFDEPVTIDADTVSIDPPVPVTAVTAGAHVIIETGALLAAGVGYTLHLTARDLSGNSDTFTAEFWGHNPRPPGLVINEFTTRGSKRRPDAIELYVIRDGNLGSVAVFDGTADNYRDRAVLPPVEVTGGDYLIIHATEDGLGEDERASPDDSDHPLAVAGVWDFWLSEGGSLSGYNGVLTVYTGPSGELLDGVLYSNRTSASDERYRGFGSKATMERADRLAELDGWQFAGAQIAPEDAVDSAATTSTRSLNRDSASTDTDSAADWHTVPTGGSSFGAANSDQVHNR